MRVFRIIPALAVLAMWAVPAAAVDLTKIERRIAKEPTYQSKAPKYCLVVFGPEAKKRVWLVLDGNALYADKNGNGDLTDKGERIEAPAPPKDAPQAPGGQQMFLVGDIADTDGKTKLGSLQVMKFGDQLTYVMLTTDKGWQGAAYDAEGTLQFADRPQDAPIIHFGGSLTMGLYGPKPTLARGDKPTELMTVIGTPGLGKGTFASISYQNVPMTVHPTVRIEFPCKELKGSPIEATVSLTHRC
jgi:hypothetical protein